MPELNATQESTDLDVDVRSRLYKLGLSEKEVDMYLTVLRHGDATAKTIADESGLSLRYVYEVAESLESRGILSLSEHATPTSVRAVPPSKAISELVTQLQTIEDDLEGLYQETGPRQTEFDLLQSRRTVLRRARSLLQNASEEVILMGPISLIRTLSEELSAARERGVLTLLAIPEWTTATGGPDEPFDELANAVRTVPGEAPFMLATDVRAGIISLSDVLTGSGSDGGAVSVVQDQLVATMVGSFFGNYWSRGRELPVTSPPSLPVVHEHFRHTVFDAVTALDGENALRAVVTCRGADNDTEIEISGEVIHVKQSLVEPATNSFPIENSLVLAADGERVTVGGRDSFLEDYEATEVLLEPIETQ